MAISITKFILFFCLFASAEIQARILLGNSVEYKITSIYGRPSMPRPPQKEISSVSPAAEKDLENFLSLVISTYEQILRSSSLPFATESSREESNNDEVVTDNGRKPTTPPPAPHHAPPHHELSAKSPPSNDLLASI